MAAGAANEDLSGRTSAWLRAALAALALAILSGALPALRRRSRQHPQRSQRRARHRPHHHRRTDQDRDRPNSGFGGARSRRHRAPHAAARARRLDQLGGVRAGQYRRRADRSPDRRAALPHGRLRNSVARSRALAHRHHHAKLRRASRSGSRARPPTSIASRSTPATSSPSSPNCAPTTCRSSICGSPTPTRTRSIRSRSTTASSSASPDCFRSSSPSCSWSKAA